MDKNELTEDEKQLATLGAIIGAICAMEDRPIFIPKEVMYRDLSKFDLYVDFREEGVELGLREV